MPTDRAEPSATTVPARAAPAAPATTTTTTAAAPATTTPTTVAVAPTTTTLADSAVAGLAEIQRNTNACVSSPASCDPTSVAMSGSPDHEWFDRLIRQYVADGLVARDIGKHRFVVESVRVGLDERSAVVVWCVADGNLLVDPRTSPALVDDIIVDDALNSRRLEGSIVLTADGWRRKDSRVLDEWLGEDRCGAS